MSAADRDRDLLARQASRLAAFRDRLLRRVAPATRGFTLDLACGPGTLTAELVSRVRGPVVAIDRDAAALHAAGAAGLRLRADAAWLPLRAGACDLIVTQCAWLWFADMDAVAREARRVLATGGALVAIGEPDFGGAIEHPPAIALAATWEDALRRAGAEPRAGRRLPGALRRAGFGTVEAEVFGSLAPPEQIAAVRRGEADQLAAIGATDAELALARRAAHAAAEAGPEALLLVPSFGIVAIA